MVPILIPYLVFLIVIKHAQNSENSRFTFCFDKFKIAAILVAMVNGLWLARHDCVGFGWLKSPLRNLGLVGPQKGSLC